MFHKRVTREIGTSLEISALRAGLQKTNSRSASTPSKWNIVRTEGDVRDNLSEWHCRSSWFAEISVDKKPPEDAFFSVGGRGRLHLKHDYWSNEDTRFRFRLIPTHNSMDQAAAERGYTYTLADYYADENLSKGLGSYLHHFRWPEHGYIDFQPIWEMRADLYYSITHNGKEYKVPPSRV